MSRADARVEATSRQLYDAALKSGLSLPQILQLLAVGIPQLLKLLEQLGGLFGNPTLAPGAYLPGPRPTPDPLEDCPVDRNHQAPGGPSAEGKTAPGAADTPPAPPPAPPPRVQRRPRPRPVEAPPAAAKPADLSDGDLEGVSAGKTGPTIARPRTRGMSTFVGFRRPAASSSVAIAPGPTGRPRLQTSTFPATGSAEDCPGGVCPVR